MRHLYKIGGILCEINNSYEFGIPKNVNAFETDFKPNYAEDKIKIDVLNDNMFTFDLGNANLIYTNNNWLSIFEKNDNLIYSYKPDGICPISYMLLDKKEKTILCYINVKNVSAKSVNILESTPFMICFMMLLIDMNGFLIHTSAIEISEYGFCFSGKSGSGKSTISRLFLTFSPYTVLTDETAIIRKINEQWVLFGTHWKGSGGDIYSNKSCELKGIYFIYHGQDNQIIPVEKKEALEIMVTQVFPFFWDQNSMLKLFTMLKKLTDDIKIQKYYFLPQKTAIEKVKRDIKLWT